MGMGWGSIPNPTLLAQYQWVSRRILCRLSQVRAVPMHGTRGPFRWQTLKRNMTNERKKNIRLLS